LLEESINKKEQSNCPNTSVDLSISPSKEATTYHDDSGYTGLDSTPRPYRRSNLHHKVKKPRFNNSTLPMYSYSTAEIIHYIMVIVMAASLCFGILVGTMVRERNNMKYQAIEYGSVRMGKGLTIMDEETGELLGGKRAAIQFYHDRQKRE